MTQPLLLAMGLASLQVTLKETKAPNERSGMALFDPSLLQLWGNPYFEETENEYFLVGVKPTTSEILRNIQ